MLRLRSKMMPGFVPLSSASGEEISRPELSLAEKFARCWIPVAVVSYALDLWRQTAAGLTNGNGRPFGDDFINYWSAAHLAWYGRAAEIYDWSAFHAFQELVVGSAIDFYHYSYPPVLPILTAPLALLRYVPALAVWLGSSWLCFYAALRLAMPGRGTLLLALSTPAVFINAIGGQNGAWTAAMLGGGLSLLERRPVIAGTLFGLLIYKPQIGVLLPVALIAGRQWRALAAAAVSAGVLVIFSVVLFGAEIWSEYFRNTGILKAAILEDGTGVWHRMVSVFVFTRRLGADVPIAYAIQTLTALGAAAAVAAIWWSDRPAPARNAALVVGTFLATPYLQDYDLVVGAFVVAWLGAARVPERPALIASFLILALPIVAASLGKATGLAFGPLFTIPAFLLIAGSLSRPGPSAVPQLQQDDRNHQRQRHHVGAHDRPAPQQNSVAEPERQP